MEAGLAICTKIVGAFFLGYGCYCRAKCMRVGGAAVVVLFWLGLFYVPSYAQERLLISHQGMDAFMLNSGCSPVVSLEVRSNNPALFDGARIELQRLIGGARAALGIECPGVNRISVKGTVDGNLCFAGATDKQWNWQLEGLFAMPVRH